MNPQPTEALPHENGGKSADDFIYTISHDLKEPLRGLSILASVLLEDYQGKTLDADGIRHLQRLVFLSRHMDKMMSDLLLFSRLNKYEPVAENVDPNAVIMEVRKAMEPLLQEKNAHIDVPKPMPQVLCDKHGLAEVFCHLISNAAKYNENSDKTIEAGMLEIMETPNGQERNVFYIRDHGIGIEPQFQGNIFRIFRRLPNSAHYDESGTGTGLAFAKEIVERNGGHIWLESEPGTGSVFYFTLN